MIARVWRGATRAEAGDAYAAYLDETGVREYRATPGNLGVLVLRRRDGELERFELVSLWRDMDAVHAFAAEPERAVFYPRDRKFLVERERTVTHHRVARATGLPPDR